MTIPGFYYSPANATVVTFKNCPTTNALFLIVGKHAGIYQEVVEYVTSSPKRYMRNYYNGTWGPWYRVFTTSNPPTYAETGALAAGGTAANALKVNGLTVLTAVPAGAKFTDTTYSIATPTVNGLMSATDKKKLDGIADGAQKNTVTGVKGNAESSYRTGNINLTPANIGAAAVSHAHSNYEAKESASQPSSYLIWLRPRK